MKSKVMLALTALVVSGLQAQAQPQPPIPKPTPSQGKNIQKREVVLPAPEFLYKEQGIDEFERKKEELKREKELLQMKVDIAKLQAELQKYQLAPRELELKLQKLQSKTQAQPQPQPTYQPERELQPQENLHIQLQREYLRMRYERERLRRLESKLNRLQNLFTGIMQVGNEKVAFDSRGRRYSVNSTVYGFRIIDIENDGIVAEYEGQVFKIPISSGIEEKKANQMVEPAPAEVPPEEPQMPIETPPPPIQ